MINVIGQGYIGLPTALMFAKSGVKVVGTDYNEKLIRSLQNGQLTFEEEGLEELFKEALSNGIKFTTEYQKTDTYIISVPTPYVKESKKLDPKYVISAVNTVLDVCEKEPILIIESTISPGTIGKYVRPEIEKRGFVIGKDVHLAHAPERIIPGNMIYELEHNSRTIGADEPEIGEKVKELYSNFCKGEIVVTDIRTAEMSKVVENTYRDINIAFANELAKICRKDNMDVYEIIRIANKHPRVNILQPGPGVGGHCISVDPWFLVGDYPDLTNLILTARKINDSMPTHVLKRIRDIMREHNIRDISKVGLYGLTYKENVDDTRESPTLQLLERMDEHLAFGVKVFDPFVKERIVDHQFMNFEDFINEIDILVIMVAHDHIADSIIMTWEGGREYIVDQGWEKTIDLNKVNHISNGVVIDSFDRNSEENQVIDSDLDNEDYKNIVYAGSIRKVNNVGLLLDAAKIIQNQGSNQIRFLIYGSGDESEMLKQRCENEGIRNVIFKGWVEKKYIPYILKKAYVNILHNSSTSLDKYGQSQNKFFEYLAAGKCIVQTYSTGYSICNRYNCGICAPVQNPEEIAKAIIKACEDEEMNKLMGENARQAAYDFDFKKLTDKLIDIIENV